MALPLTLNKVTGSLLSTVENILIPRRLLLFHGAQDSALSLYGSLTGMAMPLIQLPSALLMAVSVSLVPSIGEAMAVHNAKRIDYTLSKAMLLSFVIAMGATSVFLTFSEPICQAFYGQASLGALVFKLALLCPFLYVQITLSGILNGLGMHKFLLKNSVISSFINIGFIYFLTPQFGVDAFIAGWLCSLVVTVGLSMRRIAFEHAI